MEVRTKELFQKELDTSSIFWEVYSACIRDSEVTHSDVSESWIDGYSMMDIITFVQEFGRVPFGDFDFETVEQLNKDSNLKKEYYESL
jgi:hypothetical protein